MQWSALVGPTNAAHSVPEGFQDGVLTIRTESTTWASSLRALAPNLVAELNRQLGNGSVKRVVVLGVRDGRGPRDTYG
ncbi:putative RNA-binding protein containing Zn ribbon [Mycobacteroides abscessus subsp. abscessus]|nr:putative RNA-binding protein containing Zn ribbon [Mycobacteroides abscessus subsp. abscessus]